MNKKELVSRLEEVRLKLEIAVNQKHAEVQKIGGDLANYGREAYEKALKEYEKAVKELDGFLKTAKAQKVAIRSWVVSNKMNIFLWVGLFVGGLVVGQILSIFPSPLF